MTATPNYLLLTWDSCRYDVLLAADTPVLDSFATVVPAQTPANFTYGAHQAFFVGMLPSALEDQPYVNRFTRQLLALAEVGERNVEKHAVHRVTSDWNLVAGLRDAGYQTIGSGAMDWFRQRALTVGFEEFKFTGTNAAAQIEHLVSTIDGARPFFGFVNFGETHFPFAFAGKRDSCPVDVRPRRMSWPPRAGEEPIGIDSPAFDHQRRAAEFLDRQLGRLLSSVPADTVVILCADHGECFGEDGYWGHGVNHPKVLEVPLAVFALDGRTL